MIKVHILPIGGALLHYIEFKSELSAEDSAIMFRGLEVY